MNREPVLLVDYTWNEQFMGSTTIEKNLYYKIGPHIFNVGLSVGRSIRFRTARWNPQVGWMGIVSGCIDSRDVASVDTLVRVILKDTQLILGWEDVTVREMPSDHVRGSSGPGTGNQNAGDQDQ